MIIKNIKLFRTPLTPDYRNVYDDYSTEQAYVDFLTENFLYESFGYTSGVSRKEKNGELTVVLKGLNADAVRLHDYNYAVISTTHGGYADIYKFAFVIGMENVNDTTAAGQEGSIEVRLKLDAWANHYLDIKYEFNSIVENRCTFDTAVWRNYPSKLKEHLYSESVEYEGVLPSGITPISGDYEIVIPLWNRIYLTGKGKFSGGTISGSVDVNAVKYYDNHPTVYELCGLLCYDRNKGFKRYSGSFSYSYYDESLQSITGGTAPSYFHIESVKSSAAASSTLTFNVPFNYTVSYAQGVYSIEIDSDSRFYRGTKLENSAGSIEIISSERPRLLFYQANTPSNVEKYTSINPSPLAVQYSSALRYNTSFNSEYEQIYHEYPFNYHSIDYGKTSVPIVGGVRQYANFYLYYNCVARTIPFVSFTDLNDKTVQFPLSNYQDLPITEVQLEEYLARNSGNITNQIVQLLLSNVSALKYGSANAAMGLFTGNAGQFLAGAKQIDSVPLNTIGTAASIGLSCFDAYRTPATVRDTDSNAASTWVPSDTLSIKKHEAYGIDNYIKDYHYNGYECYYTGKISEKRRDVFDVDCGYAEISATMGSEDKAELIAAFSNGVTRWHIGENNSDRKRVLKYMNRNVINYPISLIP